MAASLSLTRSHRIISSITMVVFSLNIYLIWTAGNPRVTPEVTRDVCLLARMMAANLYFSQIEDLMFEVSETVFKLLNIFFFHFWVLDSWTCFFSFLPTPHPAPQPNKIQSCEFHHNFFVDHSSNMLHLYPYWQLSMWRCNDELRIRADELHRSSKKDAKHYIGM